MLKRNVTRKSKLLLLLVVVILILISSYVWSYAYDPEGKTTPGVITSIPGKTNEVAITLDACGAETPGASSFGYDQDLINYLIQNNIPATLFLNVRWIKNNLAIAKQLAANPLFEIQNHGYYHKPCTLSDKEVYGIAATANEQEMVTEIKSASDEIYNLLGVKTKYYRPGTGMADPKCVQVAKANGHEIVDWSLNGDEGSKKPAAQIKNNWLTAKGGDIIISHMNHPEREVAEGVMAAIPGLQEKGIKFVKLSELVTGTGAAVSPTTSSFPSSPQNQQSGMQKVSKGLSKRQEEIDYVWSNPVKGQSKSVGELIRNSNLIYDPLDSTNPWKIFDDVYYEYKPVAGQTQSGGITSGQITHLPGEDNYNSLIEQAANQFGVEAAFVKAIMKHESNFKPNLISSTGCSGLLQICGGSAHPKYIKVQCNQKGASSPRSCNNCYDWKKNGKVKTRGGEPVKWCDVCTGGNCLPDDRFNPNKNIFSGTLTIKEKIKEVGECGKDKIKAWATAYNMGSSIVNDAIQRAGGRCDNWDLVWQHIYDNTDFSTNTYTKLNGEKIHRSWLTTKKILNKKGTPSDYTGMIYLTYQKYDKSGTGPSATINPSAATTTSLVTVTGNIKVMTYNIHQGLEGINNVVQLIKQYQPDIIGLQEVKKSQFETLKNQLNMVGYFSQAYAGAGDPQGNAVLSKNNFLETITGSYSQQSTLDTGYNSGETRNYQRVKVTIKGKGITLFNTHTTHDESNGQAVNKDQIQELHNEVYNAGIQSQGNVIVVGDFNNVNTASSFSDFSSDGTSGITHLSKGKKIDFIFFSSGLTKSSAQIVTSPVASDHYPIIVGLN